MLTYTIALLLAAAVLLAAGPGREANRWAAVFLFFAAIGGLADRFGEAGWTSLENIVRLVNLIATPYAVAVFAILYAELPLSRPGRLRLWEALLLLPPAASAAFALAAPGMRVDDGWLLVWAAPYYAGSCALLAAGVVREPNRAKRRSKLVTALIMIPSLLAVLLFIYIIKPVDPSFDYFRYVSLFFLYSFAAGILFLFVYGVLGLKLRVERDPMERAMESAGFGMQLLSHSIKNEIGKIAISAENVKRSLHPDGGSDADEQLERITRSSGHLLAMAERIHGRTKRIDLRPEPCRLDRLAEEAADRLRERLERQHVAVRFAFASTPTLLADPVHLGEAIGNLLANAVEAMPNGGTIEVAVRRDRRGAALSVHDDGMGIPPDRVGRVFEPFYSTKQGAGNFGLGLSYVYNVMRASRGSVELTSRAGEGTRATLYFPISVILN
ncbi:sensor histidine kinase [Cohnella zeiphila]|uniref:histidine kinase n=1 Tax=Cohnella zeiphila TaxID=2761120 RepID=A0A7X0VZK5_9BACL|nr:HAMP domain-containing sensor histidine kinase [Cohnella zeiphila]MBB6734078.1 HAMP domain-containing histidine kinase [Cohnella zeiphila]